MDQTLEHSGSVLLSMLVFLPLFGGALLFMVPAIVTILKSIGLSKLVAGQSGSERLARGLTLLIAGATFLLSLEVVRLFDAASAKFQLIEFYPWLPRLGVNFVLGVDGISIWLLVLTTFLSLLVIIASPSIQDRVRAYLGCLLLLETGMLGTFLALDGISFYVFWELMLVPMYFLIGVWGHTRRIYAALKFVIYTALGSLLMLVAIVYLGQLYATQSGTGEMSFLLSDWMKLRIDFRTQLLLFSAFAFAFAIKVPVFPLHTWLPDAHVEAPTGGSVILAGVLLKMGLYGLIRFGIPVFPEASMAAAPVFAVLGLIGIVYGALVAWVQTDMKKLVAYSSVSHLGFCVLGYATFNLQGLQGAMLQMLNHGISTSALFFLVGVLYDRRHTRLISEYGGLSSRVPVFSTVFLMFTLSSIGLPLTNGFVGEFLILLGGFQYRPLFGAIAVTGVVLGALYMLSLYRRVSFGPLDEKKNGTLADLNTQEKIVFAPLLALVFVLGLYPQPILKTMEPAVKEHIAYLRRSVIAPEKLMLAGDKGVIEKLTWARALFKPTKGEDLH